MSWAVSRLRKQVASAAFAANHELRQARATAVLETFSNPSGPYGGTVNLTDFLRNFDAIVEGLARAERPPVHSVLRPVRLIAPHLHAPNATRAWLESYLTEFKRQEARRRRTRNALVHGGPLAELTVEATTGFAETLAGLALGACIEGRIDGCDLVDHFLETRRDLLRVVNDVRSQKPLADSLFWSDDEG